MSLFTEAEITYLTTERLLGRIATVGRDGMPHIAPVGWAFDEDGEVVEVGGHNLAATKKFKDVAQDRSRRDRDRRRPATLETSRSRDQSSCRSRRGSRAGYKIYPERIVGWGLDESSGRLSGSGSRN